MWCIGKYSVLYYLLLDRAVKDIISCNTVLLYSVCTVIYSRCCHWKWHIFTWLYCFSSMSDKLVIVLDRLLVHFFLHFSQIFIQSVSYLIDFFLYCPFCPLVRCTSYFMKLLCNLRTLMCHLIFNMHCYKAIFTEDCFSHQSLLFSLFFLFI